MEEKRPNLIYIFADQLRYSSLGYNGDNLARTPNIDSFSDECAVMDNAVSGHPVCAPYRASLLTGKYTTGGTGMVINEIRINPHHRCFAHVLNENGYETSYIGKWHMYASQLGHHYDVKNSYIPKGADRLGFDGYFAAYNFHHEYYSPKAYYHLDSNEKIYYKKYEPDEQTDMAINQIKSHTKSGKPFALFLSYGTPHDPWTKENVPKKYYDMFKSTDFPNPPNYKKFNDIHADFWAKYLPGSRSKINEQKRVYYAMTSNLDENVGRILNTVKELGISDDTIIVFTSDHGEMFGAQGRHAKNIFYEEAVRVPFLIKWGKKLKSGKNLTCMNTVDIMPTLLSMMNLPVPDTAQGTDISENIANGTIAENNCLLMGTGPTAIYGNGKEWRGIRSRKYTYAVYKIDGKEFLFDNINDPYQLSNLAKDKRYKDVLESLKNEMYEKMNAIGDSFEKNSYYKKHWVKDRIISENLK
ncbi:MAG: sulfatase [Clostridiales bacterium]|nr:sulfatase [Clostridiales bacterium]